MKLVCPNDAKVTLYVYVLVGEGVTANSPCMCMSWWGREDCQFILYVYVSGRGRGDCQFTLYMYVLVGEGRLPIHLVRVCLRERKG